MFENIENYYFPKSIPETIKRMTKEEEGRVIPFTGSYHFLYPRLIKAHTILDISRLGLDYIKIEKNTVRIGGTTDLQKIYESRELQDIAKGILPKTLHAYWSKLQRNMTNFQDILFMGISYFDCLSALVALDAQVVLQGKKKRIIPIAQAFKGLYQSVIENELVKEIYFKIPSGKIYSGFQRVALTDADLSIMNIVVLVKMSGKKSSWVRIVAGGGLPYPVRLTSLEDELTGTRFNEISISSVSQKIGSRIEPVSDIRGSKDYRREISGILLRRALTDCLTKFEGES